MVCLVLSSESNGMTIEKGFFLEYARNVERLSVLGAETRQLRWRIDAMELLLKDTPAFPTQVSEHAAMRAMERVHAYAESCKELFDEVVNVMDPAMSLSLPQNMKSFILGVLAQAYVDKRYVEQQSQSNKSINGIEWKYIVKVPSWVFGNRYIELVACVEDNVVKTVFFNWKEVSDGTA